MKNMTEQEIHEIVQDLLPLYCEGLVQNSTAAFIETHLRTCSECQKAAADFQSKNEEASQTNPPLPEIGSALKKVSRKRKWITGLLAASLLICCVLGYFAVSNKPIQSYPLPMYTTRIREKGKHLLLEVSPPQSSSLQAVPFSLKQSRENGVLNIEIVKDTNGKSENSLLIDTEGLKEIRSGYIVLWQDGVLIPQAFSILYNLEPADYSSENYLRSQIDLASSELGLTFEYAGTENSTKLDDNGIEWTFTFPNCKKDLEIAGDKSAVSPESFEHLEKTALLMLGLPSGPTTVTYKFPALDKTVTYSSKNLQSYQYDFSFPFTSLAEMTRFSETIGWEPYDYSIMQGNPVYACSYFEQPLKLTNETDETFSQIRWQLYDKNGSPLAYEGTSIDFSSGKTEPITGVPDPFENPQSEYELRVFGSTGNEIGSCTVSAASSKVSIQNKGGKIVLVCS